MKKLFLKITILISILMFFSTNVFAENENTDKDTNTISTETTNDTTKNDTKETPSETKMNETMYVQERCNIRSSYSVDSERVGGLDVGTEVKVVAEYSNGWYKIEYDGGQAYIKSAILRSTKPEVKENSIEENADESEEEKDDQISETTPKENIDEVPVEYAEIINEIGVLPEVGHNIADYLYIGIVLISIVGMIYVMKK